MSFNGSISRLSTASDSSFDIQEQNAYTLAQEKGVSMISIFLNTLPLTESFGSGTSPNDSVRYAEKCNGEQKIHSISASKHLLNGAIK
jgi:hypothetical protein